jgi:hypothetical protein
VKAPQVIYLCLTTAFWLVGCFVAVVSVPGTDTRAQDAHAGGVIFVSLIVAANLGLLLWGGFFKARD